MAELAVGFMVDLRAASRRPRSPIVRAPAPRRASRQLRGTLGIIGYGQIGRRLAQLGVALGMRVLVSDPHVEVAGPELTRTDLGTLLAGPISWWCSPWPRQRPRT